MKTPTHNATPGTLHSPCTYASMQSVLVKIAPPAQPPAPCDQRTGRVRARVDLCLDLLAKVLRSATVRSAILREENIGSAMDSLYDLLRAAQCRLRTCKDGKRRTGRVCAEVCALRLRGARCDRRNRTACATVCELRAVPCELQSCLSTCLASMLRAAICETTRGNTKLRQRAQRTWCHPYYVYGARVMIPHPPYRSHSKGRPDDRTIVFLVCC